MFFRVFFLFAVLAMAFASPKPDPQLVAYGTPGLAYPYAGYAAPLAYSAGYSYPYAYSGYYLR